MLKKPQSLFFPLFSRVVRTALLGLFGVLALSAQAADKTVITLAHQLSGEQALDLEQRINAFNAASKDVEVRLLKRTPGAASAVLNLATRADLAQYLSRADAFIPVEKLLADNKIKFNVNSIAAPLRSSVTVNKQLQALPVAFTTPLLFWNKTLFQKAGLDPNKAPHTWEEMQDDLIKLDQVRGLTCPYTTSWPVWIHIDNISAWAGSPTVENGQLAFNTLIQIRHLARLTTWYKTERYIDYGNGNAADAHFVNGECAMITTNADMVADLQASKKVDYGVAELPVIDDNTGAPFHTLAAGAALWVGQGHSKDEYRAAAKFLEYTLSPQNQLSLARQGGFLPLTPAAQAGAQGRLLRDDFKVQALGLESVSRPGAAGATQGWVSLNPRLRKIIEEEMAAVFSGKETAKTALDNAVARGQAVYQAPLGDSTDVGKAKTKAKAKPVAKRK